MARGASRDAEMKRPDWNRGLVRNLSSGRWQARYTDRARRRSHTTPGTFATKGDASRYLAPAETDRDRGKWYDHRLGPRGAGTGRRATASGGSPATVVTAAQILAKVLGAAADAGLLPASPAARVPLRRGRAPGDALPVAAGGGDAGETIDLRYSVAVLVAPYAGLRAGKLFGLCAGRVDLLRRRVDVAEIGVDVAGHFTFGPPKTRAGRRSVPLHVFSTPAGGPVRLGQWRRRF